MNATKLASAYDIDRAITALETLHSTFSERIAELRRNEVFFMFRNMEDEQFAEFVTLNVPALMAWCACNTVPPGGSFAARGMHSQLAAQESLVMYFREAVRHVRQSLALPSWELSSGREKAYASAQIVYRRMHIFLEQMEGAAAFPAELSRAALFEPHREQINMM